MSTIPTKSVEQIDDSACGQMMRDRREAKELSLRTVAVACDFSAAYLSDLELGRRKWSRELVRRVNDAIKLAAKALRAGKEAK